MITFLTNEDGDKYEKRLDALNSAIPEKLPSPHALTINGVAYDGSAAVNIDIKEGGGSSDENVSSVLYTEQTLTEEQKAQARENIGVTDGVSSWNDLTGKPFYEEGGEVEIFPEQTMEGFAYESGFSAYMLASSPAPFVLDEKKYRVVWDGAEYICNGYFSSAMGTPTVSIGNNAGLGGEATDEPFVIVYSSELDRIYYMTNDDATSHTVAIYHSTTTIKTLDAKFLPSPVSIDLSAYESDGRIVETYADGSAVTTVMEFDENGNPTKITDSNGNVTVLTW